MKIYNPSGVEILDMQVDDSSVRYRSIMNDDSLTLDFSTTGPISVPRGAYTDFEGARYTLFYPENFKKNSTRDFAYTLVLHGWREALKLYKYKDLSAKPYRLKFILTARPVDFLQLLVDCMNNADPADGWVMGDHVEADEKTVSFNHEYCFDVLNRIAEEFNTEWEITGKTIHLRKVEKFRDDPLALSYGMGNGFKTGVGRQNDGDRQPIGRLYVQGGERNIDYSEYGSASLLLPKSATLVYDGKTFRTDTDGMYITRDGNNNTAEDSYDGADFYPKRVGTVSHVIVEDVDQHFYDIRDTSIPASLNYRDCRIPGEKATIVFQSGPLSGREFDIEQTDNDLTGYIHAQRLFKIVPAELDGQIMPGGVFVPQVGDKYAIFNISMPEAYISDNATKTGASWDMFREAVRYFAEEENDKFSFTGELDGVWSKSRWLEIGGKIVPGGYVLFSDPQFQPDGILIRITAIKDYVNKTHKPEITLSNAPAAGSFSSDLGKLEAEEVFREADKKDLIRFSKRQWRDAKETMDMLQESLLNFSGSINPITVQTMQLIAGDASLQFRFVNNKTNPQPVNHNVTFNPSTKVLTASAGILQHMTLGITSLKKTHSANEYKYWDMAAYTSPALDPDKAYYLYAKCANPGTAGTFLLSETAIGMESVTGQYHFLVGILNSEQSGDRSFAPVYGYSEILPGRITTDRIVSQDGKTYFDLLDGIIGGRIKFLSTGGETDLETWANDTDQGVQDAKDKVDNLQIGGRNYTRNFKSWVLNNTTASVSEDGNTATVTLVNQNQAGGCGSNIISRTGKFIISMRVKTTLATRFYMEGRGTILKSSHDQYRSGVFFNLPANFDDRITLYYESGAVNNTWYMGIDGTNSTGKSVEISYPLLITGDKLVDWTPAPEDVDAKIVQESAYLKAALQQSTEIQGGLTLSSIIAARDGNGVVRSYQNGDPELNDVAFAAGVENFGMTNETRNIELRHGGGGKIGVLFVDERDGKVFMADPDTGEVRLLFFKGAIPTAADLIDQVSPSGQTSVGGGSTSSSQIVPGSVDVTKDGSVATFDGTTIILSAAGQRQLGGAASLVTAELWARRNGVREMVLARADLWFTETMATQKNTTENRLSFSMGILAGLYTFELVITVEGNISGATASSTPSVFRWAYNTQGVRRFEFGTNGFMAWFTNNAMHFDEQNGVFVKGAIDIPAGLGGGIFAGGSSGQIANKWGKVTSGQRDGGTCTIYHSIGDTKYMVNVSPNSSVSWYYTSKTNTSVNIVCSAPFDFSLVRTPY